MLPAKLTGRIVKREFRRDGLSLQAVIVEEKSAQRSFIAVEDGDRNLEEATHSSVKHVLETILTVGRPAALAFSDAARQSTLQPVRPL